MSVVIVGGGIGGLTLALLLHRAGIDCRVYEAATTLRPLGVGINILPHASRIFAELELDEALAGVSILTSEAVFFNRFGQLIYREPLGRAAGYEHPQYSIHRGELQQVLLDAVNDRLGADAVMTGYQCVAIDEDSNGATARFQDPVTGASMPSERAMRSSAAMDCIRPCASSCIPARARRSTRA